MDSRSKNLFEKNVIEISFAVLLTIILLFASLNLFGCFFHHFLQGASALPGSEAKGFASQSPIEKFIYFVGVMLILPLMAISFGLVRKLMVIKSFESFMTLKKVLVLWGLCILFLIIKNKMPLIEKSFIVDRFYLLLLIIPMVIFVFRNLRASYLNVVELSFSLFLSAQLYFFYILTVAQKYTVWTSINFNAVFSSVVMASRGKLGLIDYYAQYGYYSIFLKLFWSVFPLSVSFYAHVMLFLGILCFLFLYLGLSGVVQSRIIRILSVGACLYLIAISNEAPYWANLPVRLFFPSLVFWMVSRYSSLRTSKLYWGIFIIVTLAIGFNADTGIVTFLSWLLMLGYIRLTESDSLAKAAMASIKDVTIGFTFLILMLALYGCYTWFKADVFPSYSDFFIFQKAFFVDGIFSLPIKKIDLWNFVILIYLASFAFGLNIYLRKIKDRKANILVFLSFFGVGSFSYFVMRSAQPCLLVVAWPAMLILSIYADSMIRSGRNKYAIPAVLILSFLNVISLGKAIYVVNDKSIVNGPPWQQLEANRQWVKSLNLLNKDTIILSDNSGIYYLESQSLNSLAIPGSTEILNSFFTQKITDYMSVAIANKAEVYVLVDKDMMMLPHAIYDDVRALIKDLPVVTTNGPLTLYRLANF